MNSTPVRPRSGGRIRARQRHRRPAARGARPPWLPRCRSLRQDDEVVAVDDLVGHALGEVAGLLGRRRRPADRRRPGRGPWRTPRRRGRRPRRRPPRGRCPSPRRCPAGSSDRFASTSARRAPASTTTVPAEPTAKAIQSLRLARRLSRGWTTVPTASPATAPAMTPSRRASAMTARTPDQAAILAAVTLEAMPPLPRPLPVEPGQGLDLLVDLDDLLDERGRLVQAGIGGEQAGRVGEQDQQVGAQQVGHQRGRGGRCRRSGSRRRRWRRSR